MIQQPTAPVDTTAADKGAESSAPASEAQGAGLGAHGKKVSTQDIQLVQNLIERCLQDVHEPTRGTKLGVISQHPVVMIYVCTKQSTGLMVCLCMRLYRLHEPIRHQRELFTQVVYTLQQQAKVEPGFTQLVWQKLEEQNPDFFKAYYTRLKLKDQIVLFNHLLEQQVAMFQKMQRQWMAPTGKLCYQVCPSSRWQSFELLRPSGTGNQAAAHLLLPSCHG